MKTRTGKFPWLRHICLCFTIDNKLRNILNSEDGSREGRLNRNQQAYELGKFFNCRTGGIPAKDFDDRHRENLSQEVKQAAKEGREQILAIASIATALAALLTAIANIITVLRRG